jgi:hypothetical protein
VTFVTGAYGEMLAGFGRIKIAADPLTKRPLGLRQRFELTELLNAVRSEANAESKDLRAEVAAKLVQYSRRIPPVRGKAASWTLVAAIA